MSQVVKHLIDLIDRGLDFLIDIATNYPEATWAIILAVLAGGLKITLALID